MGKRRSNYEARVAQFIATNGPKFRLAQVAHTDTPLVCECCGYEPIVNHYHVVNDAGKRWVIGSECQELVLGFADAVLPAARVRNLDASQLIILGAKFGLMLDPSLSQQEMAELVITTRRASANVLGWVSRKRLAAAAAPQQSLPETGTV